MIRILVILVGTGCVTMTSYGDTIYFKNNDTIDGTIVEEDDETIRVLLDAGVIEFSKKQIARIDKRAQVNIIKKEEVNLQEEEERLKEDSIKKKMETFNALYKEFTEMRLGAKRKHWTEQLEKTKLRKGAKLFFREFKEYSAACEVLENELEHATDVEQSLYVKRAENKKSKAYRKTMPQYEEVNRIIKRVSYNVDKGYNDVREAYNLKRKLVEEGEKLLSDKELSLETPELCPPIEKKVEEAKAYFVGHTTGIIQDNRGTIIVGYINGTVRARFLIDETVPFVTLSSYFAQEHKLVKERLESETRFGKRSDKNEFDLLPNKLEGKLVDLEKLDSFDAKNIPYVVNSIKIGDALLRDVPIVLSDMYDERGVEGVLGRSFLRNFIIHEEEDAEVLLFEEFLTK